MLTISLFLFQYFCSDVRSEAAELLEIEAKLRKVLLEMAGVE